VIVAAFILANNQETQFRIWPNMGNLPLLSFKFQLLCLWNILQTLKTLKTLQTEICMLIAAKFLQKLVSTILW